MELALAGALDQVISKGHFKHLQFCDSLNILNSVEGEHNTTLQTETFLSHCLLGMHYGAVRSEFKLVAQKEIY